VEWAGYADLEPWRPLRLLLDIAGDQLRHIEVRDPDDAPPRLVAAWRAAVAGT
jgi:hypothetical protein